MRTVIFLGAGASAAEGAPIQSNLFKAYFTSIKKLPVSAREGTEGEMKKELLDFFETMFDIKVRKNDPGSITFPTFEEVLGLLDLAELRREAFKKYELEDFGRFGNRLRLIRKFVVFAMAKVISDSLNRTKDHHERLVENLSKNGILSDTVFVSTNYDIIIDNVISRRSINSPGENLDYGVEFTNFHRGDWNRPGPTATALYKLHGSLNWLYCANDNTLTLTPFVKGVIDLIKDVAIDRDRAVCRDCRSPDYESIMSPVIVPPTFYKDMSRVFLSEVWNKAEQALREADRIIFCGYSFPDADMHIKYLLKRAQANRVDPKQVKFTVINNHPGKKKQQKDDEKARYDRFFGADAVNFTNSTFEQFAENPEKFYH